VSSQQHRTCCLLPPHVAAACFTLLLQAAGLSSGSGRECCFLCCFLCCLLCCFLCCLHDLLLLLLLPAVYHCCRLRGCPQAVVARCCWAGWLQWLLPMKCVAREESTAHCSTCWVSDCYVTVIWLSYVTCYTVGHPDMWRLLSAGVVHGNAIVRNSAPFCKIWDGACCNMCYILLKLH
jgi:hypothetical protein